MGSESNFLRPHFLLYIYGETAGIKNKEEKVMNIMDLATGLDTAWVLLGAALVFFMQAGFAMVETGFTRAKNAGNIIMKNLMDFSLGTPIFWILGFGIMFGANVFGGWLSVPSFFQGANALPGDYNFATLIFRTVFCATAATIVS